MPLNFELADRHAENDSHQFVNRNRQPFLISLLLNFSPKSITKLLLFIFLTLFALVIIVTLFAGVYYFKLSEKTEKNENDGVKMSTQNNTNNREVELAFRQAYIRNMTASAFAHYRKYAWGKPALAPLSRKSTHTNMTGPLPGQTIVYAMSTFWVMDLKEEWAAGREWIANHLRLDDVNAQLDVHYTISFYIGSLLSAYALSGDQVLLIKAIEVFNALPKNGLFDLGSGLTPQKFNPKTNTYEHTANYISFQVPELIYLFNLTRNQEIGDWLAKGRAELRKRSGVHTFEKKTGFWEPAKYAWREISGHFDDMLSSYNQLGQWDTELLELFFEGVESTKKEGQFYSVDGQLYMNNFDIKTYQFVKSMDDQDCRFGGMFALSSAAYRKINYLKKAENHLEMAIKITHTCYLKAHNTKTKLLPKKFTYAKIIDSSALVDTYLAQSYFFLYRQTGDEKYREWAWELAQAINKHCRTENGGFSSLKNVDSVPAEMSDNQPANLFSSTFKYLYLIFSNQSVLPLDKWIFNRRGSPLPVCGTNVHYPKQMCER